MNESEINHALKDIGFTIGESKIYLNLLKIGESKVGPIIDSSGVSRSKVYDILERLVKKGVVSRLEKNKVLYYQALSPNHILKFLKEKEEQIKLEQKKIMELIPQLTSLSSKKDIDIKVYEGIEGFKAVIERTIQELKKDDIYEAMGVSKTTDFMRNYAIKIYQVQEKKKFKARSIFDQEGSHKIEERKNKLHEIRILPKGFHTPALFTVYNDTVGIHLGNENKTISIVIKQEEIAQSFRATFEAMWNISK